MWNTFIYEDDTYIFKIIQSSMYNVVLSNLINIWIEDLSKQDIVNRCKTLNPLISTNDETYLKTVLLITDSKISENDLVVNKSNSDVKLDYKTKVADINFKFTFNLKLSSDLSLCKEITVPVIQTIQYLEKRQKQLCELLKKKDEEIQQHIFENGILKRESVITDKFDETIFDQSTSKQLCCNLFSKSEEFSKVLIAKYGCVEPELLTVKKEEKKTKNKIPLVKQILKSKRRKLITNIEVKKESDIQL